MKTVTVRAYTRIRFARVELVKQHMRRAPRR